MTGLRETWPVIGGLTIALLLPFAVYATGAVADQTAQRRGVSELEPADRSVTASIVDSTGQNRYGTLDAGVRVAVAPLGGAPIREVIDRVASDTQGGGFTLAGVDGLAGLVRVTDGRLPSACEPARCEVVELGTSTSTTFNAAVMLSSFGLVVVGKAERTNDLVLSGTFQPDPSTPLLVGDGAQAVAALSALSSHGRTYGWVVQVDPVRLVDLGFDDWLKRAAAASEALARLHPYFVVTLPSDALAAQAHRTRISADRYRLLGAALPVLVLVAGCLVAVGRRRGWPARRWGLRRRNANDCDGGWVVTIRRGMLGGALSMLLAAGLALAICGMLGARSPLGFGRVVRSSLAGLPAAGAVLGAACAAALVVAVVSPPVSPPPSVE